MGRPLTNGESVAELTRSIAVGFPQRGMPGWAGALDEKLVTGSAALEQVSAATLDARIESDRDRLGGAAEARETLEDLRALEVMPGWWQLAYDASGELVGLVMPARAPAMTTIGYIGVVPSQRGKGYVDDLLRACRRRGLLADD